MCIIKISVKLYIFRALQGGTAAGSALAGEKGKPEQKVVGASEVKRRKIQTKRSTSPTQKKLAFISDNYGCGVTKEFTDPSAKVVPDPSVQAEETVGKAVSQIFDTVDSSNNLISPNDADNLDLRFSDAGKQKFGAEQQKSPAAEKVSGSASGGAGYEAPPIQPGESELEYYYHTYTDDRVVAYHRPPWSAV
ncbi:hypothetical protein Hanom_Chr00s001035g01672411 [Helianthus anomalus]